MRHTLTMSIQDEGPGILPKELSRVSSTSSIVVPAAR